MLRSDFYFIFMDMLRHLLFIIMYFIVTILNGVINARVRQLEQVNHSNSNFYEIQ